MTHEDRSDFGTAGPAMAARPRAVIPVANASTAIGKERVAVMAYQDAHLFDRMNRVAQLSEKQFTAAQRALGMWRATGLEPTVTGSYAPRGWTHGDDHQPDDAPCAVSDWRRMLNGLPGNEAAVIEAACMGSHPGVARLSTLQCGLDRLAKGWGIRG